MDKRSIIFERASLPSVDTLRISTDFDVAFIDNYPLYGFPAFRTGKDSLGTTTAIEMRLQFRDDFHRKNRYR